MSAYLVLRLAGPLMAFASVAVDEIRPTDVLPGASMLTGLLGNALGWCYTDQSALQSLQDRLVFASRLDRPGQELYDYQTAEISKEDLLWCVAQPGFVERAGGTYGGPVLRYRHYRADSLVTVVLGLREPASAPTLDDLALALERPARPLFLGRCSCPPTSPIYRGERVEADSPRQALEGISLPDRADSAPYTAEWPAAPEDLSGGWRVAGGRVQERADRRDWTNDIHTGWRWVVRGTIPVKEEA